MDALVPSGSMDVLILIRLGIVDSFIAIKFGIGVFFAILGLVWMLILHIGARFSMDAFIGTRFSMDAFIAIRFGLDAVASDELPPAACPDRVLALPLPLQLPHRPRTGSLLRVNSHRRG